MARPPQAPPPGAGGAYPPAPGQLPPYPGGSFDGGRQSPPPYPPGQAPIPPRRPRRRSPVIAPALAFVGLLLLAGVSVWAVSFLDGILGEASSSEPTTDTAVVAELDRTPEPGASEPSGLDPSDPPDGVEIETPEPGPVGPTAPPIVVEPPTADRADVPGTLLFARLGDIYAASGTELRRLTNSDSVRSDASPVWSPDGKQIYFIRTTKKELRDGRARYKGKYTLYPTDLMRMRADGSKRTKVFGSLINDGRGLWFRHVVQPSVSSAGNDVAVVSDGPDGEADQVTLHILESKGGRLRKVGTPSQARYGHNDPDFHPAGTKIAFTYVDSEGTNGKPKVGIFTCRSKSNCTSGKTRYLKSGTANPSWSPDGKLLAVEVTDGNGRDIALFNSKGALRVPLTTDGNSFAPEFSPAGDQIAYLKRDGIDINLRVMTLETDSNGKFTLVDDRPVTSDGLLDAASGLSWYIPRSELRERGAEPGTPEPDVGASEAPTTDDATEPAASLAPTDDDSDGPPPPPES